jgi:simple sugar transport system substrate-binding protein
MKPVMQGRAMRSWILLGFGALAFFWVTGCRQSPGDRGPEIVTVVKVSGIPWFNRMEEGVRQAAQELGMDAYQIGPSSTDEALQVRMVEDLVSKGVAAICVVPNDARALEPVFARARARGIRVLTHESPAQREHDYNVEAIDNEAFGRYHVDKLVEFMGDTGDYAIFVGSLTAPTHNLWADVGIAYAQQQYPGLRLVTDRIPFGDDQEIARQKTLEILRAYPEVRGIILFGSPGPPGAAQALKERGWVDRVAVVGTVMPRHGAPYLKDGSIRHGTLWDPRAVGYAMSYLAMRLVEGGEIQDGMEIPGWGAIRLDGKNILLDGMLRITAESVDGMGF